MACTRCVGLLAAALLLVAMAAPAQAMDAPDGAVSAWVLSGPGPLHDATLAVGLLHESGLPHHVYANLQMVSFMADRPTADHIATALDARLDAVRSFGLELDKSVRYIEADRVKDVLGTHRDGPTILMVDTGVDSTHPDFATGNLVANVQPLRVAGLVVGSLETGPVLDLGGHGTHVAGILAGSGAALGTGDALHGRYKGVYSNGRMASYLAAAPALDGEVRVDGLAVLQAYDWALHNRDADELRVVTNSWGEAGAFDAGDPITQATLLLYQAGMVVVFSAGNEGAAGPGSLNAYCVAPWVLCVAAGDLNGARAGFSSIGTAGPAAAPWDHPDVTAPGVFVHSTVPIETASAGGLVDVLLGGGTPSQTLYSVHSGTSVAAPHAAGVAALILMANPELSPDQVMDILAKTAEPMSESIDQVGAGYVNARLAYNLAVTTVGNRGAFLTGQAVKYAGPASGDPDYAHDPLTVGYAGSAGSSALALAPREGVWVATPFALTLLGFAVFFVLVGTRWRRQPV